MRQFKSSRDTEPGGHILPSASSDLPPGFYFAWMKMSAPPIAVAEYAYLSGEGVPVARPLFQEEGDGSIPISPLQLHFSRVGYRDACALNALWHSRLPRLYASNVTCSRYLLCYAAEFENRYYATAIWTNPVAANRFKDGWNMMELRRFAIAPQSPKNTASRMLGWMVRDLRKRLPNIHTLVSYQDTDVHAGTIYKASGWTPAATTEFMDWNTARRRRNAPQSTAAKVRWQLTLKTE